MADFKIILSRVAEKRSGQLFTSEELKKVEVSHQVDENNMQLLIQSITHIFKQSCKFILKPTVLEKQLVEYLKFEKDKAHEFVKVWIADMKKNFEDFENQYQLEDVAWQFNMQTASTTCKKEAIPTARIQMNLSKVKDKQKDNITFELNEEELVQLYNTLESIQTKLDTININS